MVHYFLSLVLLVAAFPAQVQQKTENQQRQKSFDPWDPTDAGMKTGPAVGETIPHFSAMDQSGRLVRFQDVKGQKGAVILFHRSADW